MPTFLTNTTGTTTAPVCPYCGCRLGVYSASTIIDGNGNEHHGCSRCMARCASCGGAARIARRLGSTGTAEQWERNPNFVNSRGADVILCQECFSHLSEDYELTTCPECLTTMDEGGAIYCEHCEVSVCRHCFEEAHRNCGRDDDYDDDDEYDGHGDVHGCGYKPSPIFRPEKRRANQCNGLDNLFLGVELEVDRANNHSDMIEVLNDRDHGEDGMPIYYLKEDGSLSSSGVEIVTHPCTIDYHRDKFPWKKVIETCKKYGAKSHDPGNCGLHIHVNKSFFGNQGTDTLALHEYKATTLVERFKPEMTKFSRRRDFGYCRFFDNYISEAMNIAESTAKNSKLRGITLSATMRSKRLYAVSRIKSDFDRYRAVNILPNHTIEFRLWRGTLRYETLIASLEMTNNLSKFIKQTSVARIEKVTWPEFAKEILTIDKPKFLGAYMSSLSLI